MCALAQGAGKLARAVARGELTTLTEGVGALGELPAADRGLVLLVRLDVLPLDLLLSLHAAEGGEAEIQVGGEALVDLREDLDACARDFALLNELRERELTVTALQRLVERDVVVRVAVPHHLHRRLVGPREGVLGDDVQVIDAEAGCRRVFDPPHGVPKLVGRHGGSLILVDGRNTVHQGVLLETQDGPVHLDDLGRLGLAGWLAAFGRVLRILGVVLGIHLGVYLRKIDPSLGPLLVTEYVHLRILFTSDKI